MTTIKTRAKIIKDLVDEKEGRKIAEVWTVTKNGCLIALPCGENKVTVVAAINKEGEVMTHGDYDAIYNIEADVKNPLNLQIENKNLLVVYYGLTPLERVGFSEGGFARGYAQALDLILRGDKDYFKDKVGSDNLEDLKGKLP